jgi:UPF0716 family protein affecting phage T7 exclusion
MTTNKNQFVQHAVTAITLILVLGALSMMWPGIIAVFLGVLLLLQALITDQELALLLWTEGGNVQCSSPLFGVLNFQPERQKISDDGHPDGVLPQLIHADILHVV